MTGSLNPVRRVATRTTKISISWFWYFLRTAVAFLVVPWRFTEFNRTAGLRCGTQVGVLPTADPT